MSKKETIDQHKRRHAKWAAPAVASVVLPVHAETSIPPNGNCRDIFIKITRTEERIEVLKVEYQECLDASDRPVSFREESLVNLVISPAYAIPQECVDITTEIVTLEIELIELRERLRICRGEPED